MTFTIFFIISLFIIFLPVLWIAETVGKWKVFKKMGVAPWKAIIPFCNTYQEYTTAWKEKYFFVWMIMLLAWFFAPTAGDTGIRIFYFCCLGILVIRFLLCQKITRRFKCSRLFGTLLFFFPFIGYPILGFSRHAFVVEHPGKVSNPTNKFGGL